jgi:hypothetical protein
MKEAAAKGDKPPDPSPDDDAAIQDLRKAVTEFVGAPPALAANAKLTSYLDDDAIDTDGIESITDEKQIFEFDRTRAPTKKENDSRIDFECGFYALRDIQSGSNKIIWRLFNSEHEDCGIKSTPELARRWFYESTTVGQALAAKKSGAA